jgi:hypothetical protein
MRTYQGGVRELAVAYGAELADTHAAYGTSGYAGLLADNLHPSIAGHQKNADTIVARIPAEPTAARPAPHSAIHGGTTGLKNRRLEGGVDYAGVAARTLLGITAERNDSTARGGIFVSGNLRELAERIRGYRGLGAASHLDQHGGRNGRAACGAQGGIRPATFPRGRLPCAAPQHRSRFSTPSATNRRNPGACHLGVVYGGRGAVTPLR